jgi:hypothetical protein
MGSSRTVAWLVKQWCPGFHPVIAEDWRHSVINEARPIVGVVGDKIPGTLLAIDLQQGIPDGADPLQLLLT